MPAREQPRHSIERMSRVCDSQNVHTTSTPRRTASSAVSRATRDLPIPGGPTTLITAPRPSPAGPDSPRGWPTRCAADQRHVGASYLAIGGADRHQPADPHGRIGPFDSHPLRRVEHREVFDQSCGGLRQHHRARWSHRFHPLGHAHLFADGVVPRERGADLAGNHLTRVHAHSHPQCHPVASLHIAGQVIGLLLDCQGGQAGSYSVILQRHRDTEDSHDAVAGELRRPAIAADRARTSLHQIGDDLAPPLGSSAAAKSIDRTTSANSTVTCLYSAESPEIRARAPHSSRTWLVLAERYRMIRTPRPPSCQHRRSQGPHHPD